MNGFLTFVCVVCACVVAVSLLGVLSPAGAMKKPLRLAVGVFILCVMITPVTKLFTSGEFKLDVPSLSSDIELDAQNAYNNEVITECESRLNTSLLSELRYKGYSVDEVKIKLKANENGGIFIDSLCIYLGSDENRLSQIAELTRQKYDVTPKLIKR